MTSTLYGDLLRAGVPIDSHESDLYFRDCEAGRTILARYPEQARIARKFYSGRDHEPWWDIPFAYLPWWQARAEADALRYGEAASVMPDVLNPEDLRD